MSFIDKHNKIGHFVIQSPGGQVHLCNIRSEENDMDNDTDNDILFDGEKRPIIEMDQMTLNHCGIIYDLTPDEYSNKNILIHYTRVVHIICSIEMLVYIFIIITADILPFGFCFIIITLIGLDSSITYNRYSMFTYLFYQYMQTIHKFYILCSLFVTMSSHDIRIHLTENNLMILRNQNGLIIFFIIANFYQVFVTYSVHRLYQLLPRHRRLIEF
jgi:hypothetical protein